MGEWKSSPIYHEYMMETQNAYPDYVPNFNWYGSAPLCGADVCDVYKAGMMPVTSGKCGDGSCCLSGEKWLGVKPIIESQRQHVKEASKECWEMSKLKEKTLQEGLKLGTQFLKVFPALARVNNKN